MKEVKTIVSTLIGTSTIENFDKEVNEAIKNGWTVVNRQAIAGYARGNYNYEPKLVAFLEREVE